MRKFLVIDEDDPVDLVVLASVVGNFDPTREVPIWLVLVGQPGGAKTDIISVVQTWKHVWTLPDDLSASTFQSSKTHNRSLLERIKESGARILFMQDMATLIDLHKNVAGQIYQQLRGIHDGLLLKETGYDSVPLAYGIEADMEGGRKVMTAIPACDRLGFLGAATPEFHAWQGRHNRLGSRFTGYTWLPHVRGDYQRLSEIDRRRSEKAHYRGHAADAVKRFLEVCMANIDDLKAIEVTDEQRDRLSAAVKIVVDVTGTTYVTDTGVRLHQRVLSIARAIAFMAGREAIAEAEVRVATEVALSQMRHQDQHQIIRFALQADRIESPWAPRDLTTYTGKVYRLFERCVSDMVDVGILEQSGRAGNAGYRYCASKHLRDLARVARVA